MISRIELGRRFDSPEWTRSWAAWRVRATSSDVFSGIVLDIDAVFSFLLLLELLVKTVVRIGMRLRTRMKARAMGLLG